MDPSERFVSNVMATAWLIADLPVPADHVLQFAEAMTTGIPGWELRKRIVDQENLFGTVLLGSLESPLGRLASNAHSVVIPQDENRFLLAQLAVSARPEFSDELDCVRLVVACSHSE